MMPVAPSKRCSHCRQLYKGRRCDCGGARKRYDDSRGNAQSRGYDYRWQKARKAFLANNPLCIRCQVEGHTEPATVVDHVTPHRGDQRLFWDANNWQALCKLHHDQKTASGR